jgi:hypothetical protein
MTLNVFGTLNTIRSFHNARTRRQVEKTSVCTDCAHNSTRATSSTTKGTCTAAAADSAYIEMRSPAAAITALASMQSPMLQ